MYQHVLVWNVCMYVCVTLQPVAATHTSSQVSVLLAAEQRGCVTVCSALCGCPLTRLQQTKVLINDSRAETCIKFFFLNIVIGTTNSLIHYILS